MFGNTLNEQTEKQEKKNGSYSMMFRSPAKFLLTCFFYDHKHALPKVSIEMFKSRTAHMHWDHFEEKRSQLVFKLFEILFRSITA